MLTPTHTRTSPLPVPLLATVSLSSMTLVLVQRWSSPLRKYTRTSRVHIIYSLLLDVPHSDRWFPALSPLLPSPHLLRPGSPLLHYHHFLHISSPTISFPSSRLSSLSLLLFSFIFHAQILHMSVQIDISVYILNSTSEEASISQGQYSCSQTMTK